MRAGSAFLHHKAGGGVLLMSIVDAPTIIPASTVEANE